MNRSWMDAGLGLIWPTRGLVVDAVVAVAVAVMEEAMVGAAVEVEVVIKANPVDMIAMALKVVEVVVGTSKAVVPVDMVVAVTAAVGTTTANTKEVEEVTVEEEAKATKVMAANPATDLSTLTDPSKCKSTKKSCDALSCPIPCSLS